MVRRSVDFRMKEKQILDKVLGPKVYDRRIRPGRGNITEGKKSYSILTIIIYISILITIL